MANEITITAKENKAALTHWGVFRLSIGGRGANNAKEWFADAEKYSSRADKGVYASKEEAQNACYSARHYNSDNLSRMHQLGMYRVSYQVRRVTKNGYLSLQSELNRPF